MPENKIEARTKLQYLDQDELLVLNKQTLKELDTAVLNRQKYLETNAVARWFEYNKGTVEGIGLVLYGTMILVAAYASESQEISEANRGASNGIPSKNINDLPQNVQDSYNQYNNNGWKGNVQGQSAGTKAGGTYQNSNGALPTTNANGNPITYKEFDVNNKLPNAGRDAQRFLSGSDGSIYYTNDHYNSFLKIK